jgi:hypothetical protein
VQKILVRVKKIVVIYLKEPFDECLFLKRHGNSIKPLHFCFLSKVYGENDPGWSRSRNFSQARARAAQKSTGSATLIENKH